MLHDFYISLKTGEDLWDFKIFKFLQKNLLENIRNYCPSEFKQKQRGVREETLRKNNIKSSSTAQK